MVLLSGLDGSKAICWHPTPPFDQSCPVALLQRNANRMVLVWAALLAWLTLPLTTGPVLAAALDGRSGPVQLTASIGLWAGWAAGLLAHLLPSAWSLTGMRTLAPFAVLSTGLAAVAGGASPAAVVVGLSASAATSALAFTGEVGHRQLQASAYGDEQRFALRPPGALALGPLQVMWLVFAVPALAGPLTLAARNWIVGIASTAFAAWFGWLLVRRLHQLSGRWLVFVPAGVVVHDPVLLAETAMYQRPSIASCGLALAGTEAADLTGGAPGPAVEFRLATEGDKVVLAPTPQRPEGVALHVRSFLVSPTRPGAALESARQRGYPGF
ncbi:MAG: hypothetical protein R2715_20940 [Ilumatobacteraceae bacterium]